MPTDDEKLKVFVIPESCLADNSIANSEGGLMLEIQALLKSCNVSTNSSQEVLLPSFKIEAANYCKELSGIRVSEDKVIKECKQIISIETSKGRYQKEGLKFEVDSKKQFIIDEPFYLGKTIIS